MATTRTVSPFPFLDAAALCALWVAFEREPALVSIELDGVAYGVTTDAGEQVHGVHVRQRDLHLIHDLDASRFGRHADCPICAAEREAVWSDQD